MRTTVPFFLLVYLLIYSSGQSQSLCVSGQCINSLVTLDPTTDVNGKQADTNSGEVMNISGVTISVYWLGAPDNVWVLDFDGQPYFQNNCSDAVPPSTNNLACNWVPVSGLSCTGPDPLGIFNSTCAALPVTFLEFSGKELDGAVLLQWKTEAEVNNARFIIERSIDGGSWQPIGYVEGNGNITGVHQYEFSDKNVSAGFVKYRLKQVDFDGRATYSKIVMVQIRVRSVFIVRNNPGTGLFELSVPSNAGHAEVEIFDVSGKLLKRDRTSPGLFIIDLRDRASGIFILNVKTETDLFTAKLIKQ